MSQEDEVAADDFTVTINGNDVTLSYAGEEHVMYELSGTATDGFFKLYSGSKQGITLNEVYLGFGKVEPYAYFELRNYLNAPVINAAYDGINYGTVDGLVQEGDPGWFLEGFNGGYINRYRGSLGVDIKLNRSSTLSFYLMGDYCIDKEVDANTEGTILKSYTKETGFRGWMGAGYEFSF